MKPKKCKQCGKPFIQSYSTLQVVCSVPCSIIWSSKKESEKRVKQMKKDLITHKDYVQILQKVFNTYIRKRDKDKPCISCGKPLTGKYDAGHFFPTTKQALRFDEDNVHGQCVQCNQHKHGNIANYANFLPKRIGWDRFEDLYAKSNAEFKVSIDWLKEKIEYYKQLNKTLLKKQS